MKKDLSPIVFSVRAEKALFTRPDLRIERFTYPVPTFGALAGVLRSIYAKPAFYWIPRRALILKPIRYQNIMINEVKEAIITQRPFIAPDRRVQKMQTYLYDVHYIVEAHFEWSGKEPNDENFGKHTDIFWRSLDAGGRRDVFLGTRECVAIVERVDAWFDVKGIRNKEVFDVIVNKFSTNLSLPVITMFHSWEWGTGKDATDTPCFSKIAVNNGVIEYPHPNDKERVVRQRFEQIER